MYLTLANVDDILNGLTVNDFHEGNEEELLYLGIEMSMEKRHLILKMLKQGRHLILQDLESDNGTYYFLYMIFAKHTYKVFIKQIEGFSIENYFVVQHDFGDYYVLQDFYHDILEGNSDLLDKATVMSTYGRQLELADAKIELKEINGKWKMIFN
ncbi:hypothetical protein [Halalkalibacter oceani]|uniref:hypothetical protein n=1 Tax=Halalkalibacter oceani TaxID=1653776 RepID=UPI00339263A6